MAVGSSNDLTYAKLGDIATQGGLDLDKQRRIFNFGDRIAEIEPMQSPWFSYLSKLRKVPTDDPSFKFLEQRHQWQRRNFHISTASTTNNLASDATLSSINVACYYDKYGRKSTSEVAPEFLLANQRIGIKGVDNSDGAEVLVVGTISGTMTNNSTYTTIGTFEVESVQKGSSITLASSGAIPGYTSVTLADNAEGQVIGSAFAQGTDSPQGWRDEMWDRDGYTQIFKTAIPLFSGTARATRYRGVSNEYLRVWKEKLKEHKADICNAFLFGVGRAASGSTAGQTWGIAPYVEAYGNRYELNYANSTYDTFLEHLENFFAPESGNSYDKLVLASRKVLTWLNKLGESGFMKNTVTSDSYRFDIQNIKGAFGHNVTKVSTVFGNLHFVQEPNLRNWMEDYAIAIDLKNVAYRPLSGNGISRDTFIKTNIQDNDTDGRKDMITTEAGLEVDLPETHAVFKWS